MDTYVVTPTYNEADNIHSLVSSILSLNIGCIVVDDNSPDGTADLAQRAGAIVIRRPGKLGLGSAVREGLCRALQDAHCTKIVTMDADFSHDPRDIPKMLSTDKDLTIGSRYIPGGCIIGWNLSRKATSWIANFICRLLLTTNVYDNTTNFRCYSRKCALFCSSPHFKEKSNEWLIVTLARAVHTNYFTTAEVPVVFVNRRQGQSKLKWRDILTWWSTVIREATL